MKFIIMMLGIIYSIASLAAVSNDSPVGTWRTIDDMTHKPKSIIKIWETPNRVLMGKITKIYPSPGKDEHEVCDACEGDLHNKPIVGMVILSNVSFHEGEWTDGEILDPQNGKTYRCHLKVVEDGKKLDVHGYIGMPLLGRSQIWERVKI